MLATDETDSFRAYSAPLRVSTN